MCNAPQLGRVVSLRTHNSPHTPAVDRGSAAVDGRLMGAVVSGLAAKLEQQLPLSDTSASMSPSLRSRRVLVLKLKVTKLII